MPLFACMLVAAIVSVVISVASAAFMLFSMSKGSKTKTEDKQLEIPSTEVGKTIPVLFGTELITDPSIATWGDLKILKVKVSTAGKK
jgi:hypothetical protein